MLRAVRKQKFRRKVTMTNAEIKKFKLRLTEETIKSLHAGDFVHLPDISILPEMRLIKGCMKL
jgi:hypothetical protein